MSLGCPKKKKGGTFFGIPENPWDDGIFVSLIWLQLVNYCTIIQINCNQYIWVIFYGAVIKRIVRCRWIYHTWILWVWSGPANLKELILITGVMGMPLISGMNTAHELGCYVVLCHLEESYCWWMTCTSWYGKYPFFFGIHTCQVVSRISSITSI